MPCDIQSFALLLALDVVSYRIVTKDLSELRAANVAAIRAARAAAIDSGVLTADPRGYDMINVPEVCAQPVFGVASSLLGDSTTSD